MMRVLILAAAVVVAAASPVPFNAEELKEKMRAKYKGKDFDQHWEKLMSGKMFGGMGGPQQAAAAAAAAAIGKYGIAKPKPKGDGGGGGGGFWAKAQSFFAAFKRKTDKTGTMGMSDIMGIGQLGPGGLMKQYDEMHKWYCGIEANKAKSLCSPDKAKTKGMHPLYSAKHAQHSEWVEMANGYCALPANQKKLLLCKGLLARMRARAAAAKKGGPQAAALAASGVPGIAASGIAGVPSKLP